MEKKKKKNKTSFDRCTIIYFFVIRWIDEFSEADSKAAIVMLIEKLAIEKNSAIFTLTFDLY